MTDDQAESGDRPVRFEALDVPPLLPLWLGAGLAGFIVIVLVGITLGYPLANHQENRGPIHALPAEPRLEVSPVRQLQAYRISKQRELAVGNVTAAMEATARQGWGSPR